MINMTDEAAQTRHYIDESGTYLGGWNAGQPEGGIEIETPPEYADQKWLFPGWGTSAMVVRIAEDAWREAELACIASQLDAIDEAESGAPPADLLPGSRPQWLAYRGAVRNWMDGADHYPDPLYRPARP